MSNFNLSSLSNLVNTKGYSDSDLQSYFWGCTLNKEKTTYRWNPESVIDEKTDKEENGNGTNGHADEDSNGSVSVDNEKDFIEHSLAINVCCLDPEATDMHVIVAKTTSVLNKASNEHPIIVMDPKQAHTICIRVEFSHSSEQKIEFILKKGSGPVYLSGTHHMLINNTPEQEDTPSDEEEDEEEEIEEEEVEGLKEDDNMDEDEEEEEDISDESPEKVKGKNIKVTVKKNGRSVKEVKKPAPKPRKRGRDTDESEDVVVEKEPVKKARKGASVENTKTKVK